MRPTVDAVGKVAQLLGVVQHLNALGVGVVAHSEGSGDSGCKFAAARTIHCYDYDYYDYFYILNVGCLDIPLGRLPRTLT